MMNLAPCNLLKAIFVFYDLFLYSKMTIKMPSPVYNAPGGGNGGWNISVTHMIWGRYGYIAGYEVRHGVVSASREHLSILTDSQQTVLQQ